LRTGNEVPPPALSVTVAAFHAPSADRAVQDLAAGLAGDVAAALGQWRWATVSTLRSQPKDAGRTVNAREIARELNVRYVVEGELLTSADTIDLGVRLVDGTTGSNAWSDHVQFLRGASASDRNADVVRLSRRLRTALYNAEIRRAAAHGASDSAWDLVLRGDAQAIASHDTVANRDASRKLYEAALRIDPDFVPALISVAMTDNSLVANELDLPPARFERAVAELDVVSARAVSIDAKDPAAWYFRGAALTWLNRWDEAVAANSRAQALDPANALYITERSWLELVAGETAQAIALAERARTMERGIMGEEGASWRAVCQAKIIAGRYEEALPDCESAAARDNWWVDQLWLAAAYAQLGRMDRATIAKNEFMKRQPHFTILKYMHAEPAFGVQEYRERADAHLLAGLRKAGIPDR
jgi:adenylate cyclase